jgi:hypothetical protein
MALPIITNWLYAGYASLPIVQESNDQMLLKYALDSAEIKRNKSHAKAQSRKTAARLRFSVLCALPPLRETFYRYE